MEEHGWRNGREEKPNENHGRDKTEVWWVELFNLPMVLLKVVAVVVPQIQCIAVCDGKTSSLNLECSETVEVPKGAVQRWGGQRPRSMSSLLHYLLFSLKILCNIFSEILLCLNIFSFLLSPFQHKETLSFL